MSFRDKVRKINADSSLTQMQKTRQIQSILTGHLDLSSRVRSPRKSRSHRPKIVKSNSIFERIKGIVHADRNKDSEYVAAGVHIVNLPSHYPDDEFCIFSQERLTDCNSVGAIVVSNTTHGQLEWKYLCNQKIDLTDENLKGVHLFDADYLIQWVSNEGEYIKCPCCRKGSSKKKKVNEHEIETMQELYDRRDRCRQNHDSQLEYYVEKLMVQKALADKWDIREHPERFQKNVEILKSICTSWVKRWRWEDYHEILKSAMKKALQIDNHQMVEIVLSEIFRSQFSWTESCLSEFLILAAGYSAFDCVKLLINRGAKQTFEAPALKSAIETRNQPLVELIMEAMLKQTLLEDSPAFRCAGLFPQVIKYNMVLAAQQIVEHRWHKPTTNDLDIAKSVDNEVHKYLQQRQNATFSLQDEDGDLDLDDWGDGSDDMDDEDW